jgi:hypothetical protein
LRAREGVRIGRHMPNVVEGIGLLAECRDGTPGVWNVSQRMDLCSVGLLAPPNKQTRRRHDVRDPRCRPRHRASNTAIVTRYTATITTAIAVIRWPGKTK